MTITYEALTPTLVENTIMQKVFVDGVHEKYTIEPIAGYVLHDKRMDEEVIDPVTMMPTGEVRLGYRTAQASFPANYNFAVNPWEFYAVPRESVPADQIYGGGNNDHEVM